MVLLNPYRFRTRLGAYSDSEIANGCTWYDGRETYRISSASGELHTHGDTYGVRSANVSWHGTVPAGTYARYALVRTLTNEPMRYRITFTFDPDTYDRERPA